MSASVIQIHETPPNDRMIRWPGQKVPNEVPEMPNEVPEMPRGTNSARLTGTNYLNRTLA